MARNSRILSDGDDRFFKLVTRLRPSQLKAGEVALSDNGRMDVDGVWQCREGYQQVSGITLATTTEPKLAAVGDPDALILIGSISGCTGADQGGGTIRIDTVSPHGIPSTGALVNLDNFTGGAGTIDGNRLATYVSTTTFDVTVAGASGAWTGGDVGPFKLSGDTVRIRGSCLFSDPATTDGDYILIADNAKATAINVATLATTEVAYPAGLTLNADCDLNQEFNMVRLRCAGVTTWEWDMDLTGSPAFAKIANGTKTQHSIFQATNSVSIASGVATVTATSHGITLDSAYDPKVDPPRRVVVVDSPFTEIENGTVFNIATVPDANTFTLKVDAENTVTAQTVVFSTGASLGGGYINAPAAAWGVEHQKRIWCPYTHDGASSPAARNVADELIASDILDGTTFDPIGNQYRITGGRADFIVGVHGFDDDRLLVFNRNSIHYLKGVSGSLDDVQSIQLTNEIGCLARRSIVSYGDSVFFWSDGGAYSVQFIDEFNLRGTELPLSEAVDSIVHRVTSSAADRIVGIYHDNRLWWALPLDGNTGAGHLLVYSLLNGGWESLDYTDLSGTQDWEIIDLIEARSGKINELYAVTSAGGVHKISGNGTDRDVMITRSGVVSKSIPSVMRTRQYPFGDLRRKKFTRLRMHLKSHANYRSQGNISVIVEDPDETIDMGAIRDEFPTGMASGETGTFHKRIGNPRGFAAQVEFTKESGLPAVRSVQMDAVSSFESTTSVGASAGATT